MSPLTPYPCEAVLAINNKWITAEAKYLLIRVLFLYGRSPVDATVETLVKEIGMTDALLKKARELLFNGGYLISPSIEPDAIKRPMRGRPRVVFMVSDLLIKDLNDLIKKQKTRSQMSNHLTERIAMLLYWKNKDVGNSAIPISKSHVEVKKKSKDKKNLKPLRPSTRVLLSVLYSNADATGVVKGLGMSALGNSAGMLSDRLESQIDKLIELGYIWSKVSGVTGKFGFGRSTGTIFLNVFDDGLGVDIDSAVLIFMKSNFTDEYNQCDWGGRLFSWAVRERRLFSDSNLTKDNNLQSRLVSADELIKQLDAIRFIFSTQGVFGDYFVNQYSDDVSDLLKFPIEVVAYDWIKEFRCFKLHEIFKDVPLLIFSQFLQYKINEYASIILSQYWDDLGFNPMDIPEQLIEQIKREVYPIRLWKKATDVVQSQLIAEALGLLIYLVSLEAALLAKGVVITVFKDKAGVLPLLNKASYAMLPLKYKEGRVDKLAIAVKLEDTYTQVRCMMINRNEEKNTGQCTVEKSDYASLNDIGYETLADFGSLMPKKPLNESQTG